MLIVEVRRFDIVDVAAKQIAITNDLAIEQLGGQLRCTSRSSGSRCADKRSRPGLRFLNPSSVNQISQIQDGSVAVRIGRTIPRYQIANDCFCRGPGLRCDLATLSRVGSSGALSDVGFFPTSNQASQTEAKNQQAKKS